VLKARYLRETDGVSAAVGYLEDSCGSELYSDRTVLLFFYRAWWEQHSGFREFFPRDHLRLPFSVEEWECLGRIAASRLALEERLTAVLRCSIKGGRLYSSPAVGKRGEPSVISRQ